MGMGDVQLVNNRLSRPPPSYLKLGVLEIDL